MSDSTCGWLGCDVVLDSTPGRGRPRKWCPDHRLARRRLTSRDSPVLLCFEPDCERALRARGMCKMHYARWLRIEGRTAADVWSDRRRNNHHARRARMNGAPNGDPVMLAALIERDGLICGICLEPLDLELIWPHPLSKSIDHIVPVSRGGAHDPSNCQLAHLRCNTQKGAKVA